MENLGIDYKLLIAQIINFGLFFFIFKKFIAGPFMNFLSREKKNEAEKQKALVLALNQEEKMKEEEKKARTEMKKEVDALIKQAKQDAGRVREEMIGRAEKEAAEIVERAKKQLNEEKTALYKELKNRTGEMSVLLINKALNNYLDEESRKKLTRYILNNLTKEIEYQ